MSIYIRAASQISIQEPLGEHCLNNPIYYRNTPYAVAIDPDYKKHLSTMQYRRLGGVLKRAIITSREVIAKSGVKEIDAVIMGTGYGCVESTEKFLEAMIIEGEEFLKPTNFIQSTHNTISSQIAIDIGCNGYNNTYVHRGMSFDSALLDAFILFKIGQIRTALVGGHDEVTPKLFKLLERLGYWKSEIDYNNKLSKGTFSGEGAVCFMLTNENNCEIYAAIDDIEMMYKPDEYIFKKVFQDFLKRNSLNISDIDCIMLGKNGDIENDSVYSNALANVFENRPTASYKHLCGEYFTSSAFGVYAAACCLKNKYIYPSLIANKTEITSQIPVNKILFYNHSNNKEHSLILLSAC